jgi:hypothetical protein
MNTTVNILECAIMVKVVRRFDGAHPDNTNSDRTVLYAIGLTPGPYIDRGSHHVSKLASHRRLHLMSMLRPMQLNCGVRGLE